MKNVTLVTASTIAVVIGSSVDALAADNGWNCNDANECSAIVQSDTQGSIGYPALYVENDATHVASSGVYAYANTGIGVSGHSSNNDGVFGNSNSSNGVMGETSAPGASAVYGQNDSGGYGVAGRTTGTGYAVYGDNASSTGYAGYFNGHVNVSKNLYVSANHSIWKLGVLWLHV